MASLRCAVSGGVQVQIGCVIECHFDAMDAASVEKAWTALFGVISETMATSIREGMDQGGVAHDIINLVQERAKLDLGLFEAADKDGSGSIDFEEVVSCKCLLPVCC